MDHRDATRSARRPSRRVLALVAIHAVAAGVLVMWPSSAPGQSGLKPTDLRARGDYTMVTGKTNSGGPSVVYLVDSANQELIALRWDQTKQAMAGIGYRNLGADGRAGKGR
jgi:hypothetical protein